MDPYHGQQDKKPEPEAMDLPDDLNLDQEEQEEKEEAGCLWFSSSVARRGSLLLGTLQTEPTRTKPKAPGLRVSGGPGVRGGSSPPDGLSRHLRVHWRLPASYLGRHGDARL